MVKKKNKDSFTVRICGLSAETEKLTKVTEVKLRPGAKRFVYFDELEDGTWRLCYTGDTIPDLSQFQGLYVVRESIDA